MYGVLFTVTIARQLTANACSLRASSFSHSASKAWRTLELVSKRQRRSVAVPSQGPYGLPF
jgi:hypothetical protein